MAIQQHQHHQHHQQQQRKYSKNFRQPRDTTAARGADSKEQEPDAKARSGGPISQLQEFVQSDRRFPVAANRPILQWQFDTRMATAITLEFRATVSFLLEGVPHHAAGSWHSSKKAAQRDAAERVLEFLQGDWSNYASQTADGIGLATSAVDTLSAFCSRLTNSSPNGNALRWRSHRSGDGWQAVVDLNVFGDVMHSLQGDVCHNEPAAREDAARRALWYLQCPGYEGAFEVSAEAVAAETLAQPSKEAWQRDADEADFSSKTQQRAAEQKTLIMTVQNRLQKLFAKQLPQNTSVWEWSYEYSADADAAFPLCRASARLAVLGRDFEGKWCQGQKAAQLDVASAVAAFLDSDEALDGQASKL